MREDYGSGSRIATDYEPFDVAKERTRLWVRMLVQTADEVVMDVGGVHAPVANALRRIMLVEVPTMAVEYVTVHRNSSILHDEQLAHRLGLVPVLADARAFAERPPGSAAATARDTLRFRLRVEAPSETISPPNGGRAQYTAVYSDQIEWVPLDAATQPVARPRLLPGVLLAKLAPGQAIDLEMDAVKGCGQEHAKWSPVATAAYRMAPRVQITRDIIGEQAQRLVRLCPMHVFDIEDGTGRAMVRRERDCTRCEECVRVVRAPVTGITDDVEEDEGEGEEEAMSPEDAADTDASFAGSIRLGHDPEHFIFSVESTGQYRADVIFLEALHILKHKCVRLLREIRRRQEKEGCG